MSTILLPEARAGRADRPEIPIHPHVYSNGVICLDLLSNGNGWSPVQSVESVCMSIQSMLTGNTKNGTPPLPRPRPPLPTNTQQSAPKATPNSSSPPAAPRGISGSYMTTQLSEPGVPALFLLYFYFFHTFYTAVEQLHYYTGYHCGRVYISIILFFSRMCGVFFIANRIKKLPHAGLATPIWVDVTCRIHEVSLAAAVYCWQTFSRS